MVSRAEVIFLVYEGEVLVHRVFVCSWFFSSVCNYKFEVSGGYNVHTRHIVHKGN
jgi:hypothetical protein